MSEFVERQNIHKVPQLECSRDYRVEYSSIVKVQDVWMPGWMEKWVHMGERENGQMENQGYIHSGN